MDENTNVLDLQECEHFSANTPYIIQGTAANYLMTGIKIHTPSFETVRSGWLVGALTEQQIDVTQEEDGTTYQNYVLQNHDGRVGFYRMTTTANNTILQGRAWLSVPTSSASSAKAFYFKPEEATGIEDVNNEMVNDKAVYDLTGRRLPDTRKGLTIVRLSDGQYKKIYHP